VISTLLRNVFVILKPFSTCSIVQMAFVSMLEDGCPFVGAGQIADSRAGARADPRNRSAFERSRAAAGWDIARPHGLGTSLKHHRSFDIPGMSAAATPRPQATLSK